MMAAPLTAPFEVLLAVDESQVRPGLIAFLVILGMGIALYFLLRSMSKHLRRIDMDRDGQKAPSDRSQEDPNG